jgi:cob(I)alamin adenosyltransferase
MHELGDSGYTQILSGETLSKSNKLLDVFGTIDELFCSIGLVHIELNKNNSIQIEIDNALILIQQQLSRMASIISDSHQHTNITEFIDYTTFLENTINSYITIYANKIPHSFVCIGVNMSAFATYIHQSRAITRRLEREIVSISNEYYQNIGILKYINRLSYYLFIVACVAS